jgi:hypothetical protein
MSEKTRHAAVVVGCICILGLFSSTALADNVIGASVTGPSNNQSAVVTIDGRPMPQTLRTTEARYGKPTTLAAKPSSSEECVARWPRLELTGVFTVALSGLRDGCIQEAGTVTLTAYGTDWRTSAGLAVGDRAGVARNLYPDTARHGRQLVLVSYFYGAGFTEPALSALASHGYIYALVAYGVPDE